MIDYPGELQLYPTKPDDAPRKRLKVSRHAEMGLNARIALRDGLQSTYRWFPQNQVRLRA